MSKIISKLRETVRKKYFLKNTNHHYVTNQKMHAVKYKLNPIK